MTYNQDIINAFSSTTLVLDRLDVQHKPVYDTVTIAAAGAVNNNTASWFTNVGGTSGKTLAQTNLTQNQRLASPEAFSIFGYRLYWSPNILMADLITLINGFALRFLSGGKEYQCGPLWYFGAGGGIAGFSTLNAASVYTNGTPDRSSMGRVAINFVIENTADFSANLEGTAVNLTAAANGGVGAILCLLLDGLWARGVR